MTNLFSFRKRKRRSDVVVVRGRLRLYSASGFFLLLGLVILAVGIGMATLGYWPHGETVPSSKSHTGGRPKTDSGGENNVTTMSSTAANFSTSGTMKGTVLFICSPSRTWRVDLLLHVLCMQAPSRQRAPSHGSWSSTATLRG